MPAPRVGVCARCGREAALVDGRLCGDCYVELYGLGEAPERLRLTVCPRCGSVRLGGRWLPPPEDLGELLGLMLVERLRKGEAVEDLELEEAVLDEEQSVLHARLRGRLRGEDGWRSVEYRVPVELSRQLCPACHRRASGAPTAIVQIRGSSGRLEEDERLAVEEALEGLGPGLAEAIISVDEVREGIDLKMLDQGAARAVAARLRAMLAARVVESYKLVTQRRDGRRVYRLTLSVRLPPFTEGSLVDYKGRLARVERIARGRVELSILGGGHARLSVEDAWRLLKQPRYEEERSVMVTSVTPGWIQLQELGGAYEFIELRRGEVTVEKEPREGEAARLVRVNGRYYLLT